MRVSKNGLGASMFQTHWSEIFEPCVQKNGGVCFSLVVCCCRALGEGTEAKASVAQNSRTLERRVGERRVGERREDGMERI